ncbi:MAG: response regulator [Leptolyngbyaceae bacterium]|nr:response regulator [Leptolyngbyaceae bacterium]
MTSPSGRKQLSTKAKLLVVDDEPDNLDLLYRTFHRDFRVLRAESGPQALEILEREGEVAVIISDQRMPYMSGTEFLGLTATRYPDIIRIILTGYTDVDDLVEAINAGKVFKYVTKPWDDEELKSVVRQAVDTHCILKERTQDLRRTLHRETLLNAVSSAIRGALSSQQILQTVVETVGHMFHADCCVLRPFHGNELSDDWYLHTSPSLGFMDVTPEGDGSATDLNISPSQLADLLWDIREVQVIQTAENDESAEGVAGSPHQTYRELGIHSSLLVPMLYQQELLAILALHHIRGPYHWAEDDIKLITLVADQVALALSQARTYEQVRALAKRETLVNMITTAIRSTLNLEEIFAAITQQLGQALRVDGCALSLWTEEDNFVHCVGLYDATASAAKDNNSSGWSSVGETWTSPLMSDGATESQFTSHPSANPSADHRPLPESFAPIDGNPVLKQLIATQAPVVVDDLSQHSELNQLDLPLRSPPARALLVVPLMTEGKIIGSISLRQVKDARVWQQDEIGLAQAVAAQAAIAVYQSRLFQTTRQQAEKLLELDRQKTEFFQNISHEFRTPLTLTIGPLESAVAKGESLPYEQSVIALRNSRRLLRLVNQLLDLQRLDAGRMQSMFCPCDLQAFVHHIVETFRPYCEKRQIYLHTHFQPCPTVFLDVEKFDKVVYNLLSNAMKFTPVGGHIHIFVRPEGDRCILQVKDSGIGIREDQIPYLFERFRQADGSTNRTYEGSGLGLALVKELVEMHGGDIHVDSVYGEGTTFTVSLRQEAHHLPAEQVSDAPVEFETDRAIVELADIYTDEDETADDEAQDSPSASRSTPDDHASVRPSDVPRTSGPTSTDEDVSHILIVDDNPDLRRYVKHVLEKAGYHVTTARNGEEGLAAAQRHRPDLILTDLMMPRMSGLEMIEAIRNDDSLKGTPMVLLTAKANEETRIEGVEQGADAYLSKPFNHRELLAEVRNLLALKASERRVAKLNTYLTETVLQRFLPQSLVEKAAHGELSLDLRPEPRLVTILFSDIVGFTQLSNTLRSRRVAELLNEYLTAMTHAIFDNGGTIDKFMGDAILAIFGAPEELSPNDQVRRAIASARQMYGALQTLNQKWSEQGIPEVQFRCGIHQGTAVVGMFGSIERSDYTAIGPSVNIAARIQEAADPGSILVSAAVADYLDDTAIQKYSPLKLKGVDETVLTFAIKADPSHGLENHG